MDREARQAEARRVDSPASTDWVAAPVVVVQRCAASAGAAPAVEGVQQAVAYFDNKMAVVDRPGQRLPPARLARFLFFAPTPKKTHIAAVLLKNQSPERTAAPAAGIPLHEPPVVLVYSLRCFLGKTSSSLVLLMCSIAVRLTQRKKTRSRQVLHICH